MRAASDNSCVIFIFFLAIMSHVLLLLWHNGKDPSAPWAMAVCQLKPKVELSEQSHWIISEPEAEFQQKHSGRIE